MAKIQKHLFFVRLSKLIAKSKGTLLHSSLIFNFRAADLNERKKHIPLVDRTPVEPPPFVIAIVGPSKVNYLLFLIVYL